MNFIYWVILSYILASMILLRSSLVTRARIKSLLFCWINLAAVYLVFFFQGRAWLQLFLFCSYLLLVLVQYLVMRKYQNHPKASWMPLVMPVFLMLALKCAPDSIMHWLYARFGIAAIFVDNYTLSLFFVGISYLAFRASPLAMEVRNGQTPVPNLSEYFGFCFYLPTFAVGPISPYSMHYSSLQAESKSRPSIERSLSRIAIGSAKYFFLSSLFNQLSFNAILMDGHPHHWIDVVVCSFFYYFYLYSNFSGFCDLAIGSAGLMGIEVHENFDSPWKARNVKEYWNRWHMTLSLYMRDMVFSPLSKYLVGKFGSRNLNHCLAIAMATVFVLIGVWHGFAIHFLIFGATHALAMVILHYYSVGLKKTLSKESFRAYNQSRWIRVTATTITFIFVVFSHFFFINSIGQLKAWWPNIQF